MWKCAVCGKTCETGNVCPVCGYKREESGTSSLAEYAVEMYTKYLRATDTDVKLRYLQTAADLGLAAAQCRMGECYQYGTGVPRDLAQAKEWYRKAAKQGDEDARKRLNELEMTGATQWYMEYTQATDPARRRYCLRMAAEMGLACAQNMMGRHYHMGDGVEQNYAEAVKWYRRAAEQGDPGAQYNLGICYDCGTGVPRNETAAAAWYHKAAEQGLAVAQYNLGKCYEDGTGVQADAVRAETWYHKAADQGFAAAQNSLGLCYEDGIGVPKNAAWAVAWYYKAAEQGDASAQYNLGRCYMNGIGIPQNMNQAAAWYRKAADQGNENAINCLKAMRKWPGTW